MKFAEALNAMDEGFRVKRESWDRMFLFIRTGCFSYDKQLHQIVGDECIQTFENTDDEILKTGVELTPVIILKTNDNKVTEGWVPSQSDMFADDWKILSRFSELK
jgi:hypothetical protein